MSESVEIPEFLRGITFVAFDTETTGLWAVTHRIVEIGAVRFRVGSPDSQSFQSLINPGRPMPQEVIAIHGITDDMVANAEPAAPVLERFFAFCGADSILIAHNAPFDLSFVGQELRRAGLPLTDNPILDTVEICRNQHPGLKSYSLEYLIRHLEVSPTQKHRALADADNVRSVFERSIGGLAGLGSVEDFLQWAGVHRLCDWVGGEVELPARYSDINVAIEGNMALEIVYVGEGRLEETRTIWPIRVEGRGSRLYVTAFCEKAKAERTFRLDRVASFRLLRTPATQ